MIIIVVGRGNLATSIQETFVRVGQDFVNWNNFDENDMVPGVDYKLLYCSNSENLERIYKLISFCEKYSIPFVNGCTDMRFLKESMELSVQGHTCFPLLGKTAYVNANNFNLMIVGVMAGINAFPALMSDDFYAEIEIIESHQDSKQSVPGTAKDIANSLRYPVCDIVSIREDCDIRSNVLGVPEEYSEGHAYHLITLKSGGTTTQIKTAVNGRNDYGTGAIKICRVIRDDMKGVYDVTELFSKK